ncbi:TRAP transporter permease [Propylenella binzhouense]|uniref:TRAP transporter fused permease subunit n=1 Tax=Propylenella binzhouense TaxID=2555902 RepID=A0A964T8C2_9HYPH|nr:TRAP transporter fused permease subunit [Propylenella binzhouense]MYZ49212.1 TRAP transporter fused permease subunit [Propylenella binzhouense]
MPVESSQRVLSGRVAGFLAVVLVLLSAAWSLTVPRMLGLAFYAEQYIAIILGLSLAVAFLTLPADRRAKRSRVPWYDAVAAALALAVGIYMGVSYPDLVNLILMRPPEVFIPGAILLVLLLEATRRATGWALVLIVLVFVAYGLFGNYVPGRLAGRAQSVEKLASYLAFDSNGILGTPLAIAATVVIAFILFGNLLTATGGSKFFTDTALLGMGRFRGGSVKIAVVASALFGSISGSAVANVVATGVITIPMIKRDGFPAHKAGAVEAVASTGGQLLPPVMGAAAFLMAEFLQMSYASVALAALVPALLYYLALFIQADLEAGRMGIAPVPASEIPPARSVLTGWHFPLGFAVLIALLFSYNWLPERAAYLACLAIVATGLVLGYQGRRPSLRQIGNAFVQTGFGVVEIVLISASAGIVIGILAVTGLSFNLTYALVQIGGGNLFLLLFLSAVVSIILGMGLPTLGVYVLLAALVAPAMVEVGVNQVAAHLYVMYFGMMSMITPPVAVAAFAAAAIAGADAMRTGFAAVKFGWTAFIIPVLFVFSPSLLLIGPTQDVVSAVTTAVIGVWLVSIGMAGFLFRSLGPALRALFIAAGILSLIPSTMFPGAVWTDVIGVGLGFLLLAREYAGGRGERPAQAGAGAK